MKEIIRNNRLIDGEPESNSQWLCSSQEIIRSIQIRIARITTNRTMEETFISNSSFSAMRTILGSISWTDSHETMSFPECFILNECSQLESAPITEDSIEYSSSVALSYSCQILHDKQGFDFCFTNNSLADNMVFISHEPFLPTTQQLKMSFGGLCAFTLKSRLETSKPINMMLYSFEETFFAGNCKLVYAEVNANKVFDRANANINLFGNTKMKKDFSTSQKQLTLSNLPISILTKIGWNDYGNLYPSTNCADAQNTIFDAEASGRVISDTAIENGFGFSSFTAFISSLDCSGNQLGLERGKSSPHLAINSIIKLKVGRMFFPTNVNSVIDCIRIDRNCLPDKQVISKSNFYYGSVIHKDMNDEQVYKGYGQMSSGYYGAIPPTAKASEPPCPNGA